jgi:hypothetical protein
MKIDGACHCGAVAYEAEIDPQRAGLCHCTDCQTITGSAFRFAVAAVPASFKLLRGELQCYVKAAQSGVPRHHHFCPICATRIYQSNADASIVYLNVGPIRQRAALRPSVQVWTRSACAWLGDIRALPAFEVQPPSV